ncbi:MAG: 50S ribosomal protein L17 [Patescibacteria group bacterium]
MRHQKSVKKIDRNHAGRKALLKSQAIGLITNSRLRTTKVKAKVTQAFVERLITRARRNTESSRRYLLACLGNVTAVNKLIKTIAPMFDQRAGGYTRVTKLGVRKGDGAELVQLEFVEQPAKSTDKPTDKVNV